MKELSFLIALVLIGMLMASHSINALTSPLSPVRPPGLEDCPCACIENVIGVGHPTCNAWCVEMYELDLAPEFVSPRIPPRSRPVPPIPPTPQTCDRPGWHRIADWMGLYPLWTDDSRYCVEGG